MEIPFQWQKRYSEFVSAIDFAEIPIERAEGEMTCFVGQMEHEAIRKTQNWLRTEQVQGCGDDLPIL